jgi:hypothetical protein
MADEEWDHVEDDHRDDDIEEEEDAETGNVDEEKAARGADVKEKAGARLINGAADAETESATDLLASLR